MTRERAGAAQPPSDGPVAIERLGHRRYVGGLWEELGQLQFNFLIQQGLSEHDYLLDLGCGSLRGGVRFIEFLSPGHYAGLEKERLLIDLARAHELCDDLVEEKQPHFIISSSFDLAPLRFAPTFVLAQSLFTHLTADDIRRCLAATRNVIAVGGVIYATFFQVRQPHLNRLTSHALLGFRYTREQMELLARETGWTPRLIGPWNHPRNQQMMRFDPA